jgi:sulfhydrogenase subunit delta
VARGEPCLGPVTRTGCGALCPRLHRGCYGCFGPADDPNMSAFIALLAAQGVDQADALRLLRGINGYAHPWRESGNAVDPDTA